MGFTCWLAVALFLVLCYCYVRLNDSKLERVPPRAQALLSRRWTPEDVQRCTEALADSPPSLVKDLLPPKTGRRYIVIGGGGFLGGWIVLHLIARGEDPRRIRILDIRPPSRADMLEGPALDVEFVRVDIADADSVEAAFRKPWPSAPSDVPGEPTPAVTVFHTAAIIRFYERHPGLQHLSDRVNVQGAQNIVNAARRTGVTVLVATSSGSIAAHRTNLILWPWQTEPQQFVQEVNDDDAMLPTRHEDFFSNYAVSKCRAERIVRNADKTPASSEGVLRTGCIRPGNGIYGTGGDLLLAQYLQVKKNFTWIANSLQSFVFVENCSLAHLLYEAQLLAGHDIGGQAFCVCDSGGPVLFGDVYRAFTQLTRGETTFTELSTTAMYFVAHVMEAYYLLRHFFLSFLPPLPGDVVYLQPSMFALTSIHLIFDDSRARSSPTQGGLGYSGVTTMQGACKVFLEHVRTPAKTGPRPFTTRAPDVGFGITRAEHGVEQIVEAGVELEHGLEHMVEKLGNGLKKTSKLMA